MYHYIGQKTKSLVEFIINFYWVIIQIPITLERYIFMFKIMGQEEEDLTYNLLTGTFSC